MSDGDRITFQIEGLERDHGDLRLEAFLDSVDALRKMLRAADEAVSKRRKIGVKYLVSDLSHRSPATVVLQPVSARPKDTAHPARVTDYVFETIAAFRERAFSPDVSDKFIECVRDLVGGINKKYVRATLRAGARAVGIDKELSSALRDYEEHDVRSLGSVTGKIERFNAHGNAQYFHIYPAVGPGVKCEFDDDLLQQAADAVEHTCTVAGIVYYHQGHIFPYRCLVHAISIHRPDDELPTLSELPGSVPGITGDDDIDDYIDRIRDGW